MLRPVTSNTDPGNLVAIIDTTGTNGLPLCPLGQHGSKVLHGPITIEKPLRSALSNNVS